MSLVGPRPERPELQKEIEKEVPEFGLRLQAKMITAKFTKENAAKLIGTRCAMKSNPRSFLGYKRIIDTEEYAVFEHPVKAASVVAAYGDIVVKRRGNTLFYIPNQWQIPASAIGTALQIKT